LLHLLNTREQPKSDQNVGNLISRKRIVQIITEKYITLPKLSLLRFINEEFGNIKIGKKAYTVYRKNFLKGGDDQDGGDGKTGKPRN
jgi:hypothetical protein